MITLATAADLPQILAIYAHARAFMAQHGNPNQWGASRPTEADITAHIAARELYVLREADAIHGVFAFILGEDPTYRVIEQGAWLSDAPYGTIHAVASDGQIHGLLSQIVAYCEQTTKHLRIDTHENNAVMRHLIARHGFLPCGTIYVEDGTPRLAFDWLAE